MRSKVKVSAVDTTFLFAYTSLFVKNIYPGKKEEGRGKREEGRGRRLPPFMIQKPIRLTDSSLIIFAKNAI